MLQIPDIQCCRSLSLNSTLRLWSHMVSCAVSNQRWEVLCVLKNQYQFHHCSSGILGSSPLVGTEFAKEAIAYLVFSQAKVDPGVFMTSHLEVDTWAPCRMCSGQEVCCKNLVEALLNTQVPNTKQKWKKAQKQALQPVPALSWTLFFCWIE